MSLSIRTARARAFGLALLISLAITASTAGAQSNPGSSGPAPESATLRYENRDIVTFRAMSVGRSPKQRADGAASRVDAAVASGRPGKVTTGTIPEGTLILIGGQGMFVITPADVDSLAGETMSGAAAHAASTLALALQEANEARTPSIILWSVVRTLIYTILFIVAMRMLFRLARRFESRLQERAVGQARKLSPGGPAAEAEQVGRAAMHGIVRILVWAVALVCAHLWLTVSLNQFPYTRPWGEDLTHMLLHALEDVGLACVHAAPGLFFVVVIFFMTRLLARAIGMFFHAVEEERITVPGLHADTALPTRRIVVVIVWVLALAVAYPFLPGSKSEAFKGISVLFGIMISLGSSGTINQLASGLTLMYSRALRVGDYVQIKDVEGTVTGMSLLTVKIRTIKRVEVSIPNAVVVAAETRNYSRLGGREGVIVHSTVTIGYSAPWRQVHAMLIQAAQRTAGIKKQPVPFVHQTSLDDFYVSYQVNGHLEDPHTRLRALADLHRHIQDVFNEYGVQIMSPHYENDPATGSPIVPKSRWYAAPATPEADAGTPPDA